MSDVRDRIRWLGQARDGLTKAAAALTEPGRDNLVFALFHTTLALWRIAKADDDLAAHDRVLAICNAAHPPRPTIPGPYSGT